MKKAATFSLAVLVLCLLLTMTACSQKNDVTVEQLLEANTNEKLFEQYDSVLLLQEYSYGEIMVYRTKDFKCYTSGDDYCEAYLDGRYYCNDTQGCYAAIGCFPMSVPLDEPLIFNEYLTRSETPVDVKNDGDHLVLTTTVVPDMVAETMEYLRQPLFNSSPHSR